MPLTTVITPARFLVLDTSDACVWTLTGGVRQQEQRPRGSLLSPLRWGGGVSVLSVMSAPAGAVWCDPGWEPARGCLWTPGRLPGGLLEGHPPSQQQSPQPPSQPHFSHLHPARQPHASLQLTGKRSPRPRPGCQRSICSHQAGLSWVSCVPVRKAV